MGNESPNLFHATLYRLKKAISELDNILDGNEGECLSTCDNEKRQNIRQTNESNVKKINVVNSVNEVNILWYQGETDALKSDLSESYASRFCDFVEKFRSRLKEDSI